MTPFAFKEKYLIYGFALLACCALFVFPDAAPWASFYPEYIFSAVFLALAFYTLSKNSTHIHISRSGLFAAIVAVFLILSYIASPYPYHGAFLLAGLYFLAAMLVFIFATSFKSEESIIIKCTFLFFIFSGLASLGVQILQLFSLDIMSTGRLNGRLSGMFGQPNIAGTFFILSICSLVYFSKSSKFSISRYFLICGMVFGLSLTQSRTGFLNAILLAAVFFIYKEKTVKKFLYSLAALLAFWAAAYYLLNGAEAGHLAASSRDLSSGAGRLEIWRMSLDAIMQRPWFGYGLGNVSQAQLASPYFLPGRAVLGYSHNFILDIAIWLGIIPAILISFIFIFILLKALPIIRASNAGAAIFMGFLAIFIHALLEAPLSYAYLLLPFAVFFGFLFSFVANDNAVKISTKALALPFLLLLIPMIFIMQDYRLVQKAIKTSVVYSQGREVKKSDLMPERFLMLDHWKDFFQVFYQPTQALNEENIKKLHYLAAALPNNALDAKLIFSLQEKGDELGAIRHLMKACSTEAQDACDALKSVPIIAKTVQARDSLCASKVQSGSNLLLSPDNLPVAACY